MNAIDPILALPATLYVDADGALLTAEDDTSNPLPLGATPAAALLVNADGELVVSAL